MVALGEKDDDVDRADGGRVGGRGHARHRLVLPAHDRDAVPRDRVYQPLHSVDENGLVTGLMEAGAEDRSHCSGADDGDLHNPPSSTGMRSYRSTNDGRTPGSVVAACSNSPRS